MVIDDSSTICNTAKIFLSSDEYEVFTVEDGFEALSEIIEQRPNIIFLDVLMPKIDGLETCQVLKSSDELKDIPIIILSSKDGVFDKARGSMVGANDYLTKPFKKHEIINMVKQYTEKASELKEIK